MLCKIISNYELILYEEVKKAFGNSIMLNNTGI